MQQVSMIGRLVDDPEIKEIEKDGRETVIGIYRLAVPRIQYEGTDFFQCKSFNNAVNPLKYLHKGSRVFVSGEFRSGSYENESHERVYTMEFIVSKYEFLEKNTKMDEE